MTIFNKKSIILILLTATSCILLLFQNCAPPFKQDTTDNSYLAKLQRDFPSISNVEPAANVQFQNNELKCVGECTVSFISAPTQTFPNIQCDGSLRISNDQIYCDNNLTLSR